MDWRDLLRLLKLNCLQIVPSHCQLHIIASRVFHKASLHNLEVGRVIKNAQPSCLLIWALPEVAQNIVKHFTFKNLGESHVHD